MNNEVRKPPRELKLHISLNARVGAIGVSVEAHNTEFTQGEVIHVREILPGDDSIRVSRVLWDEMKSYLDKPGMTNRERTLLNTMIQVERIERESKEG